MANRGMSQAERLKELEKKVCDIQKARAAGWENVTGILDGLDGRVKSCEERLADIDQVRAENRPKLRVFRWIRTAYGCLQGNPILFCFLVLAALYVIGRFKNFITF